MVLDLRERERERERESHPIWNSALIQEVKCSFSNYRGEVYFAPNYRMLNVIFLLNISNYRGEVYFAPNYRMLNVIFLLNN
jgi:hypothetical protein